MQHWIVATLIGVVLGIGLYGFVRLRMCIAPRLKTRFGDSARYAFWILTIVLMIAVANIALWVLRVYLRSYPPIEYGLHLEIWFSLLALIVGLGLVLMRVYRHH